MRFGSHLRLCEAIPTLQVANFAAGVPLVVFNNVRKTILPFTAIERTHVEGISIGTVLPQDQNNTGLGSIQKWLPALWAQHQNSDTPSKKVPAMPHHQ